MKKQRNLISRTAVLTLALGALCCSGSLFAAEEKKDAAKASTELDSSDKDFMMQAATDGMREVHMGQMGQKQGKSAEVKKLANMIVSDHTKANNELKALAKRKGVTLDTKHDMDKIDDDDFDKEWLEMMADDHAKDIKAFEKQAKDGTDADVKKFASKTLPVLKKHEKAVKDAQAKLKNGGSGEAKKS